MHSTSPHAITWLLLIQLFFNYTQMHVIDYYTYSLAFLATCAFLSAENLSIMKCFWYPYWLDRIINSVDSWQWHHFSWTVLDCYSIDSRERIPSVYGERSTLKIWQNPLHSFILMIETLKNTILINAFTPVNVTRVKFSRMAID